MERHPARESGGERRTARMHGLSVPRVRRAMPLSPRTNHMHVDTSIPHPTRKAARSSRRSQPCGVPRCTSRPPPSPQVLPCNRGAPLPVGGPAPQALTLCPFCSATSPLPPTAKASLAGLANLCTARPRVGGFAGWECGAGCEEVSEGVRWFDN